MFEPKMEYRYFVKVPTKYIPNGDFWHEGKNKKTINRYDLKHFDSGMTLGEAKTRHRYWATMKGFATPEFNAAVKIVVMARMVLESGLEDYDGTQH